MIILHTSDWHLGHKLYGRNRYQEHRSFLNWLTQSIEEQQVSALIVAGDIFDSQTPSNQSLAMYYSFLSRVAQSCCRHVIIIGGNHDSPTLLNAPKEILSFLNIHIIGKVPENIEDELILLKDQSGVPELMVLAVPYLRDKDIRSSVAGESMADKQKNMISGIRDHYSRLTERAVQRMKEMGLQLPIIATGHLFCQGGKTRQGDGIRELYVGTLLHLGLDTFPDAIDYLALGHLHLPQKISQQELRRYSGAPLALSFSEAGDTKQVLLIDTDQTLTVEEIPVPCFQPLQSLSGDLNSILEQIAKLKAADKSILLEVDYQGKGFMDDLQEQISNAVEGSRLTVLRISNKRIRDHVLKQTTEIKTLDELTPHQVFQQCLEVNDVPVEEHAELIRGFDTALDALQREVENK